MHETDYPYIAGGGDDWRVYYLGDDGTEVDQHLDASDEIEAADEVRALLDVPDDQDILIWYD